MKKYKRTDIKLKSITIDLNRPIPDQLKMVRKFLNITVKELAGIIGCHPTNINYYENPKNYHTDGSTKFLFKYVQALGIKEIRFNL